MAHASGCLGVVELIVVFGSCYFFGRLLAGREYITWVVGVFASADCVECTETGTGLRSAVCMPFVKDRVFGYRPPVRCRGNSSSHVGRR